jgi:phospholipid/cholesterol/gamma-HCH transport system substrate-binding protein
MPAKKSNFTVTEIKAGVMVLVSVLVMVAFVAAMRGCGSGAVPMNRFSADFTSIIGLNLAAEVRFGGVKAGKVLEIAADPEDRSRIRVVFEVPADVPINHGSVATIEQISLTTGKHLEISTGGADAPLHVSGDQIASYTKTGGFVDIPDVEGVITRLETMLDGLITLLGVERAQALAKESGEEIVDLAAVAAALEKTLNAGTSTVEHLDGVISDNRAGLAEIVGRLVDLEKSATELLTNLNTAVEENRGPLNATMVNFQDLSAEASRQLEELTASLAVTLQYLQEVSGNTSALVEGKRPTLEQILDNLEATTRSLKKFSQSLAEQPNALVRGAKPQGRPDGGK